MFMAPNQSSREGVGSKDQDSLKDRVFASLGIRSAGGEAAHSGLRARASRSRDQRSYCSAFAGSGSVRPLIQ